MSDRIPAPTMGIDASHPNNLRTAEAGIDLLQRFHRFSQDPYDHRCGLRAIGYEHILRPCDQKLNHVTEAQARQLLREDVRCIEIYLNASVRVPLSQNEFDALISFIFEVGMLDFEHSDLRRELNMGNKEAARDELRDWGLRQGYRESNYRARRQAEATLFERGALAND